MTWASMAEVVGVVEAPAKGIIVQTWSFASGATHQRGNALGAPMYGGKTIIVRATSFSPSEATVTTKLTRLTLEGSNATTPTGVYVPLHAAAPSIGPLNLIADFSDIGDATGQGLIIEVLDNPRWIRPRASTATAPMTVSIICQSPLR
jgi:hypothetical protein